MSGRNPFTRRDEDFLVQYIAKYNPQPDGRNGNALYQRLVANEGRQWPWAKRHPWSSWRDYYVRNRNRMDRQIARLIERQTPGVPHSSAPKTSQVTQSSANRVQFTKEDDQHLVEFLASVSPATGGKKGTKLWVALAEDHQKRPWTKRHSWQSWRERYMNNEAYFERAVKQHIMGDTSDFDEPEVPRPRTVEDWRVHKRSANAAPKRAPLEAASHDEGDTLLNTTTRGATSSDKRKRQSETPSDAPPMKKKTRIDKTTSKERESTNEQHDEPGPTAAHDDTTNLDQDASEDEHDEPVDELEHDSSEEELGTPGLDDYHGEIFDAPEPTGLSDEEVGPPSEAGSSAAEQEETYEMLTQPGIEDQADADVVMDVEEQSDHNAPREEDIDAKPFANPSQELLDSIPPAPSPPPRRPTVRIQHDIDAREGTPTPSPTEEAEARYRREHDHSPAPPRKHVHRIRRSNDENFFGTPVDKSTSPSASSTAQNSPTMRHLAHVRERTHSEEPSKPREPPRLDEGAWNKAFSDARGRPRVDVPGKAPRKSGVDFDEDATVIGTQDQAIAHDDDDIEEEPEETQMQWPPMRRKDKRAAPVPAPSTPRTPGAVRDKGRSRETTVSPRRVVTTEKIVSVKTVRTVERRRPRTNGTPYARGPAVVDADDEEADDQVDDATEPETSQHHPFSQPVAAPGLTLSSSTSSTGSRAPPLSKADTLRLQKMLERAVNGKEPPQTSPSKKERDARQTEGGSATVPLSAAERARLATLLKLHGKAVDAHPSISRTNMSPVGAHSNKPERFDEFEERDEELPTVVDVPRAQSSPFANMDDKQNESIEKIVPDHPFSKANNAAQVLQKGKGRADAVDGNHRRRTLGGPPARPVVLSEPDNTVYQKQLGRRSMPTALNFSEDDLNQRTALSLLFHPPPSGSAHARSYTLPRPSGLGSHSSRSVSPAKSADASLADTLPPHELELIKELGMQTALTVMARNHGFSEEIVRSVYAETRSLEATDHVLREMRESANETANRAIEMLSSDRIEGDEADSDEEVGIDDDQADDYEEVDVPRRGTDDEAEVEHALDEDSWMQDDLPLAESSRMGLSFGASKSRRQSSGGPNGSSGTDTRRRQSFRIMRIPREDGETVDEYSPPKRTRAAKHLKRQSFGQPQDTHDFEQDARDVDATIFEGSPAAAVDNRKGKSRGTPSGLGELARLDATRWRGLGSEGAKILQGMSLAKLLQ